MKIISGTEQFHTDLDTAVAIGKFDGVHLGHRAILSKITKQKARGLTPAVFTFEPSAAVFFGGGYVKEISLREDKRRVFASCGVGLLIEFPLNDDTARIPAETFLEEVLVKKLRMKYIACGQDVSFGYRGEGDSALLSARRERFGYELSIVEKLKTKEGREISSTLLREALSSGDMLLANEILGAPYTIRGTVESGRRLGRRLGMPTMNIYPDPARQLPKNGVYETDVLYDNATYKGITNIGVRPTVSDEPRISVETYLYDFDTDMYGKTIEVQFLKFKRPERKFSSVDELKKQMERDTRKSL